MDNCRYSWYCHHLIVCGIIVINLAFAAVGSLFAGNLSDRFGRRMMIIGSSVVFTAGGIVWLVFFNLIYFIEYFSGAATGKPVLLLGRVLLGLAIGISF